MSVAGLVGGVSEWAGRGCSQQHRWQADPGEVSRADHRAIGPGEGGQQTKGWACTEQIHAQARCVTNPLQPLGSASAQPPTPGTSRESGPRRGRPQAGVHAHVGVSM